jgi:hypothetical protein
MGDSTASEIKDLVDKADADARASAYEQATTGLRAALDLAERERLAPWAIATLSRLFVLDMLAEDADARVLRLVGWLERPPAGAPSLWTAHLAEVGAVRERWPSPRANGHLACRDILFAAKERGFLGWDEGAVRLAELTMTGPGQIDVKLPASPRLTEAMAVGCLSTLLPFPPGDIFDTIEPTAERWVVRFPATGRACLLRGAGDFDGHPP